MIDYGEKPSNQNTMELEGDKGLYWMRKARQWVEDNPGQWEKYMLIAKTESRFGTLSPGYPLQILRHRHRASIPTDLSPYLARIATEQDPEIRFRLAKSRADGYCEVKL